MLSTIQIRARPTIGRPILSADIRHFSNYSVSAFIMADKLMLKIYIYPNPLIQPESSRANAEIIGVVHVCKCVHGKLATVTRHTLLE